MTKASLRRLRLSEANVPNSPQPIGNEEGQTITRSNRRASVDKKATSAGVWRRAYLLEFGLVMPISTGGIATPAAIFSAQVDNLTWGHKEREYGRYSTTRVSAYIGLLQQRGACDDWLLKFISWLKKMIRGITFGAGFGP